MATSYGLICPLLTDDPVYAYGVEFGMLYARMRDGDEAVIEDYFCRANQDQILLLASRTGWHVAAMEPFDERCWMRFRLVRKGPGAGRAPGPGRQPATGW